MPALLGAPVRNVAAVPGEWFLLHSCSSLPLPPGPLLPRPVPQPAVLAPCSPSVPSPARAVTALLLSQAGGSWGWGWGWGPSAQWLLWHLEMPPLLHLEQEPHLHQ